MRSGRRRSRRKAGSRIATRAARGAVVAIEVGEGHDRHAVEALGLEIRQLAKRLGLEVRTLQVEAVEREPSA